MYIPEIFLLAAVVVVAFLWSVCNALQYVCIMESTISFAFSDNKPFVSISRVVTPIFSLYFLYSLASVWCRCLFVSYNSVSISITLYFTLLFFPHSRDTTLSYGICWNVNKTQKQLQSKCIAYETAFFPFAHVWHSILIVYLAYILIFGL